MLPPEHEGDTATRPRPGSGSDHWRPGVTGTLGQVSRHTQNTAMPSLPCPPASTTLRCLIQHTGCPKIRSERSNKFAFK